MQVSSSKHLSDEPDTACSLPHDKCCVLQDKRRKVKLHEDAAVNHHMLLLLRSNTHLEQQVHLHTGTPDTLIHNHHHLTRQV